MQKTALIVLIIARYLLSSLQTFAMSEVKEKKHSFPFPVGYNKRYTLDVLIKRKALNDATTITKIVKELLQELKQAGPDVALKERMLYKYRSQEIGQDGPPLSDDRIQVIADYFGVNTEELYTE